VIASTVLLHQYLGGQALTGRHLPALLLVYGLAALMVSNVRYWSFKEINLHRRQPFWVLIAIIILLKLFIAEPQIFLVTFFWGFALSGPVRWMVQYVRRWMIRRRRLGRAAQQGLTKAGMVL